ncbi:MAG: leucyl/phenylalanyl-tRNA--protein transferase [candidate division KSB1 bacterium]|nr:leucyl/phenylalanyl-tRNA--protein transferase [candidate division KSB1 bacterium]
MIPADILLNAYSRGIFPMADESSEINWYEADPRTILDIHDYRIPHDLRRIINRGIFKVYFDRDFEQVIRACAERETTWISEELIESYLNLHKLGYAHSVEAWLNSNVTGNQSADDNTERLVGGLYGVALGAAFFGESMFHRVSNASKVALAHLVEHLKARGFELHDAQMMTPTVKLFGGRQISRGEYMARLAVALRQQRTF